MADKTNNFVNFLTLDINATMINDYMDTVTNAGRGYDDSTGGYTKAAWAFIVAEKMEIAGTLTQDIKDAVARIVEVAYDDKSAEGYNLFQMITVYHSKEEGYSYTLIADLWPSYLEHFVSQVKDYSKMNVLTVATVSRMYGAISFIVDNLIDEAPSVIHEFETHGTSPFLEAAKVYANGNDSILPSLKKLSLSPSSTMHYGELNKDGDISKIIDNKFVSVIMQLSFEAFKRFSEVSEVKVVIDNEDLTGYQKKTAIRFDGLGDGDVLYSGGNFPGYGLAHIAVLQFGESVLNEISLIENYSSYGENLSAGDIDGISLASLISGVAKLSTGGTWNIPTGFLSAAGSTSDEVYANYGNVRDFTKGGRINFYGAVNNILSEFRTYHVALFEASDKTVSATSMTGMPGIFSSIVGSILPGISYQFYVKWLLFFNQDIS